LVATKVYSAAGADIVMESISLTGLFLSEHLLHTIKTCPEIDAMMTCTNIVRTIGSGLAL
jgi:hypothetical protein